MRTRYVSVIWEQVRWTRGRMRIGIAAALLAGCFGTSAQVGAQTLASRNPEYRLQSGDELDIHFRYTPEFDQVVKVRPDHRVTLLNLGTLVTADLTVGEFEQKVVELSGTRLVNPQVTVLLKSFDQPHVFVEGEVSTPGRVELHGDLTILDAIALAGGFKNSAAQGQVLLLRRSPSGGEAETTSIDLAKLLKEKKLEEVGPVHPGDVIYVTQNKISKVERIARLGQFGAMYNPIR